MSESKLLKKFKKFIDKALPKEVNEETIRGFTLEKLKEEFLIFWLNENEGRPARGETQHRFIMSAWCEWSEKINKDIDITIHELEEYGYY